MRRIARPDIAKIDITQLLYALSDPDRLEIVKKLANKKSMTCGELNCDRPKSSMSHHFKILRDAGIIETLIEGKEHLNSLRSVELEKKFPSLLKSILKVL